MELSSAAGAKSLRRRDDHIVLHFDYDCFYAQVVENQQPMLKSLPLGIKQKGILATCNYVARRRGVGKLMQITEAKKICPDLVLVEGEDLSLFRDISKKLYGLLRTYSWNDRVERLGLDEVFLDVTDVVAYNVQLLNPYALEQSFFYLSRDDPEKGFPYDASSFAGCLHGSDTPALAMTHLDMDSLRMRLLVASHMAHHIRLKIEEEGYTSACGISTNKLLAKMVGTKNKPRNQTTLLALHNQDVLSFVDGFGLRKIPGIGARTSRILQNYSCTTVPPPVPDAQLEERAMTARQARMLPGMSPQLLDRLLGGPGAERGLGTKVWGLLHGVEDSPVKSGADFPTQISIEDTYKGLNEMAEIHTELHKLSASLLRRMHVDLVVADHQVPGAAEGPPARRWIAHPRSLRLSTAPKWLPSDGRPYMFGRASRSQALPAFVFSLATPPDELVAKLVAEVLLGMFAKLNPAPRGWNLGMLNVCVANMVPAGSETGAGTGRNIATMFRRQEDVLREFTTYDDGSAADDSAGHTPEPSEGSPTVPAVQEDASLEGVELNVDSESEWEDGGGSKDATERCQLCGHLIPLFALTAHARFHEQVSWP